MSYKLKFHEEGKREWDKLDWTIRKQFPPALEKRLPSHRVQSAKLLDAPDCYKSYIVRVLATITVPAKSLTQLPDGENSSRMVCCMPIAAWRGLAAWRMGRPTTM